MCEIMEKLVKEAVMEDRIKRARRAISVLYSLPEDERDSHKLTHEEIAYICNLSLSEVEDLARKGAGEQAKAE